MPSDTFDTAALARAMQSATDDIVAEVNRLIAGAATTLESRLKRAYPRKTGTLVGSIFQTSPRRIVVTSRGVIPRQVRVTSPHVHFYQEGTAERVDATRKNAKRGRAPAHGPIFERLASEVRGVMLDAAQQVLYKPRTLI